jgi:ABC-type transport system involved in multi-copper enzyme maturation permease subunit
MKKYLNFWNGLTLATMFWLSSMLSDKIGTTPEPSTYSWWHIVAFITWSGLFFFLGRRGREEELERGEG